MKTVHVSKTYDVGSGTNNIWNKWRLMIEDAVLPIFQDFNNLTYLGMTSVANAGQFVFSINDTSNVFLRMSLGNGNSNSSSIALCTSDSGSLTTNPANIGNQQYWPQGRISRIDNGTKAFFDFWMYYITDSEDNLRVFWTPNPTFGGKDLSNAKVFVTTAKGRDVIVDFPVAFYELNAFFLDDPGRINYKIPQDASVYSSDGDVLKSNFIPIRTAGALTDPIVDLIDEDFIHIYNTEINALGYNSDKFNNTSTNVRRLIRVDNKYYRQIVNNWWFLDPLGDEPVVEIFDT